VVRLSQISVSEYSKDAINLQMYICKLLSFYSMNNSHRSNLKRTRDLFLSDTIEDDHVDDEDSGSDNDSDFVPDCMR